MSESDDPEIEERQVPAGWYDDAHNPNLQQYWDGERWTDAKRPKEGPTASSSATAGGAEKERGSDALVVVGYITALLLPIVGFVLGIVLLVRRQTVHGLIVFLLSIAVAFAACSIALNGAEDEINATSDCLEKADTLREINQC